MRQGSPHEEDPWDDPIKRDLPEAHGNWQLDGQHQITSRVWNPILVKRPVIDHDLVELGWVERTVSVIRYAVLGIEYWLSPRGALRELLRLTLWVAVVCAITGAVIIPACSNVLEGAVELTGLTASMVDNITRSVTSLPPIVVALVSLYFIAKLLRYYRDRRLMRRGYPNDGY